MATINSTDKTYTCTVTFDGNLLSVLAEVKGGQTKSVVIDRSRLSISSLSKGETDLLNDLDFQASSTGLDSFERVFSFAECALLAGMRNKVGVPVPPSRPVSPVVAVPAPKPVVTTVPSPSVNHTPSPVQEKVASSQQTERDVNRTMDSSHNGLASRHAHTEESKTLDMERVINKLKNEGGLVLLNYYIPKELSNTVPATATTEAIGIRVPNPASSFRGFAVHLDGSNWLMTKKGLESETVQDFFATMDEHKDFIGGTGEPPRLLVHPPSARRSMRSSCGWLRRSSLGTWSTSILR